ncbi:poly(A)-specific ribonuclease PARN isoform X3 [Fopius arisanus]|uniref:Poly(A)-specific ribonuclease PARN isoform X3 n=1 Tax=Fopius arisanus TaxID=64838 RepID=A0A9R1U624_9HYME|nr:PREDICTED: poly(A)-specific ribonuclease PARN-like isoform X3 [Fopius arisanus]
MEVTRENFQDVLQELDDVLAKSTFLGIDGEFTGLNSGPEAKVFDTPAQYYLKLKSGSMDFLLVQFGLSVFTHDTVTNKYNQRTYNFYVFPRPLNRAAPDCRFMCQASSIAFLASQGFDFNKLFTKGIPYLTTTEEEKLMKRYEEKQKIRDEGLDMIPISEEDKPQIIDICKKIDDFLESDAEELLIERCNGYIRRLAHQEVRQRWPEKIRLESRVEGGAQSLIVFKMGSREEEDKKHKERQEREQLEIKEAVGVSALLRKIADSGKLIVGHNMLLDLCHVVHQFFGPLPESYLEFKSLINGLFPKLIDTKVFSSLPPFKDLIPSSILNHIFESVTKEPFSIPEITPIENRSYATVQGAYHEAGFDAYVTGLCFLAMTNYLGSQQSTKVDTVLPDSPLLHPFINKLLIFRLNDIPYINLVGPDPIPSRDHVFHVTFPRNWKLSNLSQTFNPWGGVYVSWLSDTTAYVGLNRREQAPGLRKKVKKNGHLGDCQIQTYTRHQASVELIKDNNTEVDRKRKQPPTENDAERIYQKNYFTQLQHCQSQQSRQGRCWCGNRDPPFP